MRSAYLSALFLGLATPFLAGCAGDANPIRDIAIASGVTGGEPKPAPDFVTRSRSANVDYMPVGVSAPKRPIKAKTKEEVGKYEADLDRTRATNEARGSELRREAGSDAKASGR